MGKLLEKILSPVKTLVAAAVITAAVAGMPSEAQGESLKEFEYFTQSRNITTGHLVSPAEKGKTGERGDGVNDLGKYQKERREPRIAENVGMEIKYEREKLSIVYSCEPKIFSKRLPVYEQMFREDSANTHIYFLLPKHVTPLKEKQLLMGINNRTMNHAIHIGTPFEDTKLCEAIKNMNIATEERAKPRDCDMQEMERAYDNTADTIGGVTGAGMKGLKGITKWGMNKAEKKRIKKIRENYGENYQIHKMPFHQIDGPVFKYTYFSREASLFLDTSEIIDGDKAYIIIPQLSFTQDVAGTTRRATLENLAYEIPLEAEKVEKFIKKYSREDSRKILNGKWNSLKGDKSITMKFNDEIAPPRRKGGTAVQGKYIDGRGKEWEIIKDEKTKNSPSHKISLGYMDNRYGPEFNERIIGVISSNIIRGGDYFIKEGTKIEKLNSLEDLAGTWKLKESFLKTFGPKKQEEGKSWRTIIQKDKVLLEYMGDGKMEMEIDKVLTKSPVIKIDSFYFIPNENYYNGFIIKINENNLLMSQGERNIPLVRVPNR